MELEEKVKFTSGNTYWETYGNEEIKSLKMSDGPHGLRIQRGKADLLGINPSDKSICFPTASCIASSWDKNLLFEYGKLLGEECRSEGINVILGPGVNIKRTPLCGRNFEYFSEDPYLSGMLGSSYINGVQSQNVGVSVKHFALNNQENRRMTINVCADKKAINEIYLKPFELIVKNSNPISIMTSYNKVNGDYVAENKYIMNILRNKWNFKNLVITDWGANNNRVESLKCGVDIDMPSCGGKTNYEIEKAINDKKLSIKYLDDSINRIKNISTILNNQNNEKYDLNKHHKKAVELAKESIILMKNEKNILPLKKTDKIVFIGDFVEKIRYQGSGSSTINPYKVDSFISLIDPKNYYKGYERIANYNDVKLLREVKENITKTDKVVLFIGLTENYESEGMDRKNIELPKNQIKLYKEISKITDNIIIVLLGGSVVNLNFLDNAKAILNAYLPGEGGAKAIYDILYGNTNPSGKLAETYPKSYIKNLGNMYDVLYKESIFVGYRYYDIYKEEIKYPFGFGLSYTNFQYSNLKTTKREIIFDIKNIGLFDGKEVYQVYLSKKNSKLIRPLKELKYFDKISLKKNEKKTIKIDIKNIDLKVFYKDKWIIENGEYEILIGSSSQDIKFKTTINVSSKDNIKKEKSKYYDRDLKNINIEDFEKILNYKIKSSKSKFVSMNSTIEQLKFRLLPYYLYKKYYIMPKLMKSGNTNKATKVLMDLQKPLRNYCRKSNSKYTVEQIQKFIEVQNLFKKKK